MGQSAEQWVINGAMAELLVHGLWCFPMGFGKGSFGALWGYVHCTLALWFITSSVILTYLFTLISLLSLQMEKGWGIREMFVVFITFKKITFVPPIAYISERNGNTCYIYLHHHHSFSVGSPSVNTIKFGKLHIYIKYILFITSISFKLDATKTDPVVELLYLSGFVPMLKGKFCVAKSENRGRFASKNIFPLKYRTGILFK